MKIGFLLPTYSRKLSGGKKVIFEYANYLAEKGHDITLYFPYENYRGKLNKLLIPNCLKILLFTLISKYDKITWFELNKSIRRKGLSVVDNNNVENAGAIIATAVETASLVNRLNRRKGSKFYFIQDYENWNLEDKQVEDTYKLGMVNIVISKWLKTIVDTKSETDSILISDGINTDVFNVSIPIENRIKHSVVFQYRKAPNKGAKYAFETIRLLEKKYSDLKVFCISREDRPEDLPTSCEFYHNLSAEQVAMINNKAQVFMCSSINEGFGLPGLEAMACGCALISSEYTGVLEYAKNEINSLLSEPKDYNKMASNISRLFDDELYRLQLIQSGIETARDSSFINSAEKFEKTILENVDR